MINNENGVFTKDEILSQPETWKSTIEELEKDWRGKWPNIKKYRHIVFTGCGSTHYLSIWASRFVQRHLGISSQSVPASELWYSIKDWVNPFDNVLLVAISRSGETTETLHAIEEFNKAGKSDTIAITCYPESRLAKSTKISISTPAGQEKSIAQTRSFSNMMLAVILLAFNEISENFTDKFSLQTRQFLDKNLDTAIALGRNKEISQFFFLGNGPQFGLANEVMLKMKEMSLSYSEAFHFLEFRHGPMSMVNKNSLVIGLLDPELSKFEIPVLKDMKNLGAEIFAVGSKPNNKLDKNFNTVNLPDEIQTICSYPLYLPLLQYMGYERSLTKGLNPDKPENLTAVVELE